MIKLDIISDPVCPWCYIGKTNLDRALENHPDHPFEIEWHPFRLNPDMPPEGVLRRTYLEKKFGAENLTAMHARMAEIAREAGINIDFDAVERAPNTLDAHRLIHWAGLEGRQTAMVSRLFRAYWRDCLDIGDKKVLADLAADVGMDKEVVARLLQSDADVENITARDRHARERGVNSVPSFIIANQYVVSGAQPPETWAQVIAELEAQTNEQDAAS